MGDTEVQGRASARGNVGFKGIQGMTDPLSCVETRLVGRRRTASGSPQASPTAPTALRVSTSPTRLATPSRLRCPPGPLRSPPGLRAPDAFTASMHVSSANAKNVDGVRWIGAMRRPMQSHLDHHILRRPTDPVARTVRRTQFTDQTGRVLQPDRPTESLDSTRHRRRCAPDGSTGSGEH